MDFLFFNFVFFSWVSGILQCFIAHEYAHTCTHTHLLHKWEKHIAPFAMVTLSNYVLARQSSMYFLKNENHGKAIGIQNN